MKSQKILIVSDDEGVRESLKLILGDHYDLALTDSGDQAMRCLEKTSDVGLVLWGIGASGINSAEGIRQVQEKRPDLKMVIVINDRSLHAADQAAPAGVAGYIVRPFRSGHVLNMVKNIL